MYWREVLAQSIVFFIALSFVSAVLMYKINEIGGSDAVRSNDTDEM